MHFITLEETICTRIDSTLSVVRRIAFARALTQATVPSSSTCATCGVAQVDAEYPVLEIFDAASAPDHARRPKRPRPRERFGRKGQYMPTNTDRDDVEFVEDIVVRFHL
jgi:hypothetical protein